MEILWKYCGNIVEKIMEKIVENIVQILWKRHLENLSGYLLCQLEALAMPERASRLTAKKITQTPTEARHLIVWYDMRMSLMVTTPII